MSNKALSLHNAPESEWTIVSGPLSGSKVKIHASEFSIGRSHDCDLSIPHDPKVSRKQAKVYWDGHSYHVKSLSKDNPVLIDGKPISDSEIHSGTIIQLGDSQLRFLESGAEMIPMVDDPIAQPHLAPIPNPYSQPAPYQAPRPPRRQKKRAPKASSSVFNIKRLLIYGLIGGILWWLLSPSDKKGEDPFAIRNEKQIEADINDAKELQKIAQKNRTERLNPSLSQSKAQEHYVIGFRDYQKGQFERSIGSFQACLALNPSHALCNRYLKLSQKKFGELVQYHMVLGRKYRDQNQFRACRSAFRNVMVMVRDPSSSIYKEAKTNFVACDNMLEGRF